MKKILIILLVFVLVSCDKDDTAYYTINNSCMLSSVGSTSSGDYFFYNSSAQIVKRVSGYTNDQGVFNYDQATDSIIYEDGYPKEAYSFDYENYYVRHEKYLLNDSKISSINYTIYKNGGSTFVNSGETNFTYNGSKIINSETIEDYYTLKKYINISYEYEGNNLVEANEVSWYEAGDFEGSSSVLIGDTVSETRKYSYDTDILNPYNGFFLIYDLREESFSENIYGYYEYTSGGSYGYSTYSNPTYDNGLLKSHGIDNFYYDCD